ncbi:MAG: hypothetical protein R2877_06740 [Bdellovibrionota bacterium]
MKHGTSETLSIGKVSKLSGVGIETIRFYETKDWSKNHLVENRDTGNTPLMC